MAADKLSVSFEADLADIVRQAAAEEGVTLSSWLSAAAQDRIRNRLLRAALDEVAADVGPMSPDEVEQIVAAARSSAILTVPKRRRAR